MNRDRALRRALVFATSALEPLAALAQQAEAAGFDRVWTTEYLQRDAVARALHVVGRTRTIEVGTGIAYAFTRPPVAMGGLASDVRRLSDGRFSLGLGTGSRGVRRWYGAEFEPPAKRFMAYVDELRDVFDGIPELAQVGPPPIYGAGLMPVMTRSAVRASDGVLLHPLALVRPHLYERILPAIARGGEDRGAPGFSAAWCITSIADDEEEAHERARRQIAFYLSTPSYAGVVEGTAWEAVATNVRQSFDDSGRRASWAELAHLVPSSLVEELAIVGTPATAAARAREVERELADAGFDEIVFQTVGADLSDEEVAANCSAILSALSAGATLSDR